MDRNLELALIESLIEQGEINIDPIVAHCDAVQKQVEDDEERSRELWSQPIPELVDHLLGQGFQERFPSIRKLTLDGGSEVYELTSYFWDGEDDAYDIRSFDGIEICKDLERITIISMLPVKEPVSLAPLSRLPGLRYLSLHAGLLRDAETLLEMPGLEQLSLGSYVKLAGTDREALLQKLRDKGVKVES